MTLYSIIYNIAKQQEICLKGSDIEILSDVFWHPAFSLKADGGSPMTTSGFVVAKSVQKHPTAHMDSIVDGLCYCLEIVFGESFQELTSLLMQ